MRSFIPEWLKLELLEEIFKPVNKKYNYQGFMYFHSHTTNYDPWFLIFSKNELLDDHYRSRYKDTTDIKTAKFKIFNVQVFKPSVYIGNIRSWYHNGADQVLPILPASIVLLEGHNVKEFMANAVMRDFAQIEKTPIGDDKGGEESVDYINCKFYLSSLRNFVTSMEKLSG